MTPLRQRMIEDMQMRNLSPHTVAAYVGAVAAFARHFGKSPDQLSGEQVRQYLLHLVKDQHASWSRYNQARCALQFLHRVTLGRDEWFKKLPCAKVPKRLPTVLSTDEVRRLLEVAAHHPKHKALLMTLLGHTSLKTTALYTHVSQARLRGAASPLDLLYAEPAPTPAAATKKTQSPPVS